MAHFAKVEKGIVVQVIVAEQSHVDTLDGDWVQTSYNTLGGVHLLGGTPFRKNYATLGGKYDAQRDAFLDPKPFPSWILNETTCIWEAPVQKPTDGQSYEWNESTQQWELNE